MRKVSGPLDVLEQPPDAQQAFAEVGRHRVVLEKVIDVGERGPRLLLGHSDERTTLEMGIAIAREPAKMLLSVSTAQVSAGVVGDQMATPATTWWESLEGTQSAIPNRLDDARHWVSVYDHLVRAFESIERDARFEDEAILAHIRTRAQDARDRREYWRRITEVE